MCCVGAAAASNRHGARTVSKRRQRERSDAGTFSASLAFDELLAEIAVAKFAAAEQRRALTEPFFDEIRSHQCPTAGWITRSTKLSWAELVEVCTDPTRATRLSGVRRRRDQAGYQAGWTEEGARWAIRLIGTRAGWRVSRFDYDAEREALLRGITKTDESDFALPTAVQVERAMKQPFGQVSHSLLEHLPMAPTPKTVDALMPLVLEASGGIAPTLAELRLFCEVNRISVTHTGDKDPLPALARHLADPNSAPTPRPNFAIKIPPSERTRPRRRTEWDCVYGLALYLLNLEPGEQASEPGYQHFSSKRDDIPWYRSFPQHGGFERLLPQARALEKQMRDGFDPGPTIIERRRLRTSEGREALWANVLDDAGHKPWNEAPEFDPTRALAYLASRKSDEWCAYLVKLTAPEGVQTREIVEAGLATANDTVNQWRRELSDLGLIEHRGRGFSKRAAGPSTNRWRLAEGIELPGTIYERAQDASQRSATWTASLDETLRAIAAQRKPSRFYPKELAKTLSISPQNAAIRLKRLEQLGAVRRVAQTKERGRPSLWSMTETGLERLLDLRRPQFDAHEG